MTTERHTAHETPADLSGWREQIDAIDEQLLELLNSRFAISIAIAGVKRERGIPVSDVRREFSIVERLADLSEGPLDIEQIQIIYSSIFEASRALQDKILSSDPQ